MEIFSSPTAKTPGDACDAGEGSGGVSAQRSCDELSSPFGERTLKGEKGEKGRKHCST